MIDLYPSASPDILWSEEVAGEAGDGKRSKERVSTEASAYSCMHINNSHKLQAVLASFAENQTKIVCLSGTMSISLNSDVNIAVIWQGHIKTDGI